MEQFYINRYYNIEKKQGEFHSNLENSYNETSLKYIDYKNFSLNYQYCLKGTLLKIIKWNRKRKLFEIEINNILVFITIEELWNFFSI